MGILTNPRHELFAQELAKGKSATEAYTLAGYKPCRQNAARLTTNDDIRARLAEIQAQAAKKSEVTVQSLLDELEHARARADGLDQLSAAVKAISEKAKISGLLVQKIEVGDAGAFSECETLTQIADEMLSGWGSPIEQFCPIDQRDRQGLIDILERRASEVREYLAALKARPIAAERVDLNKLPTDWQSLKPYSAVPHSAAPGRIGNGNHCFTDRDRSRGS